jgi:outer membrane protein assembly factor BamA
MRSWIISIVVVLTGVSYVQCQQASESNKVSYEGQKVAAVDLVANPKISVESLRPLVQQKTGEPYSGSKVENTISALRGTGLFSKVGVAG